MPTVVAAAAVAAIGLSGVAATAATIAVGAVVSMAVNALTISPTKNRTTTLSSAERKEMVRSAILPRRVIYGRARVSGPLVFAYTTDLNSGAKNFFLHMVVAIAGHEVEDYGTLYVNDEAVELVMGADGWRVPPLGSRYLNGAQRDGVNGTLMGSNLLQTRYHSGVDVQASDFYLMRDVPVWTEAHRLQGSAYIYAKLYWDSNVWSSGLPNLSVVVKGRLVEDPRTGTKSWSDNPALCIRDYLLSDFGMHCAADEIDEASFIAAANLCDEMVPVTNGADQKRYTCNGVFSLDEKPIDIMEHLLSSCAGALVYTQGQYRLYPAAYRLPQITLDESALRGPVVVRPMPPRQKRPNTVRGTYISPDHAWQASDFVPVTNATYLAQDCGEVIAQELDLPFTNNSATAQRLAQLQLERSRRALTVEMPCTLAALDVAVMEPVRLTIAQLGWKDKVFLPTEWTLSDDGGVNLVLVEDDPALYAWNGGVGAGSETPQVVLPDVYPSPPRLTLSDDVSDNTVRLIATLSGVEDAFISSCEVEYRPQGSENWQSAGRGSVVIISNVAMGQSYEVRARSLNLLGMASSWVMAVRQIIGSSQPPGDVAALVASLIDSTLYLSWSKPSGLVSSYRLRWSSLLSGASWTSAIDVAREISDTQASIPARRGSYLLKAADQLGRESPNAAVYVNPTPDPRGSNVVATLTEHPAFAGAKTNCSLNASNQLMISSLMAFDAQSGNFDSVTENFDSTGGGTSSEGIYEFATLVDLGAAYGLRGAAHIKANVLDLVSDFDSAPDDFDTREGQFEGQAPSAVDVVIEVSTTSDNPAGSPVWSSWQQLSVGDLVARGLRFRARLLTTNPMATPLVDELMVTLDMPDRVTSGSNAASAVAGDSITFSSAFYATPVISITPNNLQTGDYVVVSGKSRSGFTVQFKNSAGVGVSRSYDWVARGFGRAQ